MAALAVRAEPGEIARQAVALGCRGVAYTYNDPIVFAEYAINTADACRELGLLNIAVTAGYISAAPRAEFFGAMDAANIDLKGFSDDFYRRLTGGRLATVLETLRYAVHESPAWVEVTNLIIPGHNDGTPELEALATWIAKELGPDIPLHLSAFHPAARMQSVPRTPVSTLRRARQIALDAGLRFVYLGNVQTDDGAATVCPRCQAKVVDRRGYAIVRYALTPDGSCTGCGEPIPGRWERVAPRRS
jgi:pyruvate formate lyase activating enzyme